MRKRSPANSAASSPPVPARTSRMALLSSAASFGSNCTLSCCSRCSIFASSAPNSSSASAAMSFSEDGSSISCCKSSCSRMRRAERVDGRHDRIELGELARQAHKALLIAAGGERALHRPPTGDEHVEFLGGNRGHVREIESGLGLDGKRDWLRGSGKPVRFAATRVVRVEGRRRGLRRLGPRLSRL